MGDWNRTTRKITMDQIRPDMAQAIQTHLDSFNLGPILSDQLICVETTSTKKKKGLFGGGGDQQVISVDIVTPNWLMLVTRGDKSASAVAHTIQLKDSFITDYKDSPNYKLLQDTGLDITGIFTGIIGMNNEPQVSMFIPLGEEPAAIEFKNILFEEFKKSRL
jgi:hypothetical protein